MSIIYTVDPAEVASETNFHTIQEAIDAAAGVAGAGNPVEIRIAAGIYKEALTFPAGKGNITLSGARAGVDASSPERGTGETVLVGYILGADGGGALTNVTIDGMTIEAASQAQIDAGEIRNSGNVPYHGVIWSQYQSDGFTLKNNIITNAGNPAKGTIWLGAQENATITGNRVTTVLPDGEVKKAATLEIGGTSGTTTITGNVFIPCQNDAEFSFFFQVFAVEYVASRGRIAREANTRRGIIARVAAVNTRIRTDFNVMSDNNAPQLRDFRMPLRAHEKAKLMSMYVFDDGKYSGTPVMHIDENGKVTQLPDWHGFADTNNDAHLSDQEIKNQRATVPPFTEHTGHLLLMRCPSGH